MPRRVCRLLALQAVLRETRPLVDTDLPRSVQIEPVGRRRMSPSLSPAALRVDGLRNAVPALLSFDAFCRLLGELPELEELRLEGDGEPLSHPRFFDMVRHAAARGIRVSTTSRLQRFSQRRAEECVKSGLAELRVPLDAAGTRAYDFGRRGPRHERMLRHLRWLAEARRSHTSLLPQVSLVAVALRSNVGRLGEVVKLARECGADAVKVQELREFIGTGGVPPNHKRFRRFVEAEALGPGDAASLEMSFAEARALAKELDVSLVLPAWGDAAPAGCPWPWRASYLDFSGEAHSCDLAARSAAASFGNALKHGLSAVWCNDAYRKFRERHVAGEPPAPCAACPRLHRPQG